MTEQLLQYIWQFQYYNRSSLSTTDGETLQIITQGLHNKNQGPDFLNAQIKCGNTILAGSIEIHINASEWNAHKHSTDKNYNNVILHVVWKEDKNLKLPFPVLELYNRVSNLLLEKYEQLMNTQQFIPCAAIIRNINELTLSSWKHRLLVERLQDKSVYINQLLKENNNHWEQVFWQMLAKNFGAKINGEAFENIAKTIPINILAKSKYQIHQLEAMLMGQAGLLNDDFVDDYPIMLKKEYYYLKNKYSLAEQPFSVNFLRMRPANFPTLRLSQLASLIFKSNHLFSTILEAEDVKTIEKLFDVSTNDYWLYHYCFDEPSVYKNKNLGEQMIQNIIINTVLPMLYSYGWYHNNEDYKTKAISWLEKLSPEKNVITIGFSKLGISNKTAFDSQAYIQLKNKYCNYKKCLDCAIGNAILKENKTA